MANKSPLALYSGQIQEMATGDSVPSASTITTQALNQTGATIPACTPVYISGANGDNPTISLASAASEATSTKTLGFTVSAITNGSIGTIQTAGLLAGFDTSSTSAGTSVWLSATAGAIQFGSAPTQPNHGVFLGKVVRVQQNNGSIFVQVQNGYEISELHDVLITSAANNNLLAYDSSTSLWKNVSVINGVSVGATTPSTVTGTTLTAADQTSFKETTSVLPTIMPTLNLDFANSKTVDPRITFTRATTATYYDGVTTAMAEQNLLTYSQTFSNAAWVASNITVGAVTTAPDGTSTAYPLTATAGNGTLLQTFTATANAYTFSIYIQRVTGTGNIDITVDGVTYATQTTTGTWTRFTITTTPAAGSKTAGIRLATSGDVVNIWGAQLEQRSSATAYTATTTAPITNYIPVLMTAASGAPRLDYDPVTRQPKGLLIEEQRTNLLTYSEQFDNAAWTKGAGVTVTPNATASPDGAITADLISSPQDLGCYKNVLSVGTGITITNSIYIKAGTATQLLFRDDVGSGRHIVINPITGQITGTSGTIVSSGSVSVGNGWYRYYMTYVTDSASCRNWVRNNTAGTLTYYTWGAQIETGAFPTSYIPTVASQVTRNADQASMTGTNFSSWYNQGQGTFDVEMYDFNGTGARAFTISDNTANNVVYIANNAAGVTTSGSARASFSNTFNSGKSALSFTSANYGQSVNGGTVSTSTTAGNMPVVSQLQLGASTVGNYLNGHIRNVKNYPVAQSNAILQGLTS